MLHSASPIVFPDRFPTIGLKSLSMVRFELSCETNSLAEQLLPGEKESLVRNGHATCKLIATDPLTAIVLSKAARSELKIFLAEQTGSWCYLINSSALRERIPGFDAWDSIATDRLVVAPPRMPHGSIETRLNGQPIFFKPSELDCALGRRPTSAAELERIGKEVIEIAKSEGLMPRKKELIERILDHDDVRGVSKNQVETIVWQHAPSAWKRPGPKSKL